MCKSIKKWWPLASSFILIRWLMPLQRILQDWERKRHFSPENVFELLQASVFLLAVGRLMEILQTNVAMGWSSAAAGVLLLGVSSSTETLKKVVPIVAPHAATMEQMMLTVASNSFLQRGLEAMVGTASSFIHHTTPSASSGASGPTIARQSATSSA